MRRTRTGSGTAAERRARSSRPRAARRRSAASSAGVWVTRSPARRARPRARKPARPVGKEVSVAVRVTESSGQEQVSAVPVEVHAEGHVAVRQGHLLLGEGQPLVIGATVEDQARQPLDGPQVKVSRGTLAEDDARIGGGAIVPVVVGPAAASSGRSVARMWTSRLVGGKVTRERSWAPVWRTRRPPSSIPSSPERSPKPPQVARARSTRQRWRRWPGRAGASARAPPPAGKR